MLIVKVNVKSKSKVKVKVAQLCLILSDPMDYTVHVILKTKRTYWMSEPVTCINLLTVHMERMCRNWGREDTIAMRSQYPVRQWLKSTGTQAVSYRNSLHQDIIQPV